MNYRHKLDLLLLVIAVGVSRFAFRSHDLYDLDSVDFALALGRFDPRVYQPGKSLQTVQAGEWNMLPGPPQIGPCSSRRSIEHRSRVCIL